MISIKSACLLKLKTTILTAAVIFPTLALLSGCVTENVVAEPDSRTSTQIKPSFEESQFQLRKAEHERASARLQEAKKNYEKLREITSRYRQQNQQAQAELKKILQRFSTTDVKRNSFFTEQACTKSADFKPKYEVSARSIKRAFELQKEKLENYQALAKHHSQKSETLKSTNNTTAYLNAQADYWICVHNYDYYASRYYVEAEACEQELKFHTNRENAAMARLQVARQDLVEKTDALTYGIITTDKVKRLTEAMSIVQVEKIIGPGTPVRSVSVYKGPLRIELDEYRWDCLDGNGILTILFNGDKLYQKDVEWSGRSREAIAGRD